MAGLLLNFYRNRKSLTDNIAIKKEHLKYYLRPNIQIKIKCTFLIEHKIIILLIVCKSKPRKTSI